MLRRTVGFLLDGALIGLVAVVVLTAAVGPAAALSGRTPVVIGGGSMAPAIPKGAIALVGPADATSIEPGDVVTFRTPASVVVTHRIVRIVDRPDGRWYETKGDGNPHPDPALWPSAAVVGTVELSVPGLGFTSWLFHQPAGWLNVGVIAAWLLLARRMVRRPEPFLAHLAARPGHHRSPQARKHAAAAAPRTPG